MGSINTLIVHSAYAQVARFDLGLPVLQRAADIGQIAFYPFARRLVNNVHDPVGQGEDQGIIWIGLETSTLKYSSTPLTSVHSLGQYFDRKRNVSFGFYYDMCRVDVYVYQFGPYPLVAFVFDQFEGDPDFDGVVELVTEFALASHAPYIVNGRDRYRDVLWEHFIDGETVKLVTFADYPDGPRFQIPASRWAKHTHGLRAVGVHPGLGGRVPAEVAAWDATADPHGFVWYRSVGFV